MVNYNDSINQNKEPNKPCVRCLTFITQNDIKYEMNCVIDSGASCNLINFNSPIFRVQAFEINERKFELSGAFGGSQQIVGKVKLTVVIGKNTELIEFFVVKNAIFTCLLGYPTIIKLRIQINADQVLCRNKQKVGRISENTIHLIDKLNNQKTYFIDFANALDTKNVFLDRNNQLMQVLTNEITVKKNEGLKILHYSDIETENGFSRIPSDETNFLRVVKTQVVYLETINSNISKNSRFQNHNQLSFMPLMIERNL